MKKGNKEEVRTRGQRKESENRIIRQNIRKEMRQERSQKNGKDEL